MILSGFFLSGFLLALLGAALPGWGYHVTDQHSRAGWLFFSVGLGLALAGQIPRLAPRFSARSYRIAACAISAALLLLFGLLRSPVPFSSQAVLWVILGVAVGLLNMSLFESIHDRYTANPAFTVTRSGLWFVSGCLSASLAVAAAYNIGFVSQTPAALALVPSTFGILFLRSRSRSAIAAPHPALRQAIGAFSTPGALLSGFLVVFESGSEWTVAGWLPVFLTHRIGASPESAVWMLSLYWLVILIGRATSGYLLRKISHRRFLFGSAFCALLGCVLLVFTDNAFGATAGILFLGSGLAGVFPLLAEKMGSRFPEYHPEMFNGIFSLALCGGLFSAWIAGLLAASWGLTAVVALPAVATSIVVALLLVLWLESKVTGR